MSNAELNDDQKISVEVSCFASGRATAVKEEGSNKTTGRIKVVAVVVVFLRKGEGGRSTRAQAGVITFPEPARLPARGETRNTRGHT